MDISIELYNTDHTVTGNFAKVDLGTLQNELQVKGEFDAVLRNQSCGKRTKFFVIKGLINSPPLISKNTLIELGMLEIREDGSFAASNDICIPEEISTINAVDKQRTLNHDIEATTSKLSNIFEGIGRVRDIKMKKSSMCSSV